MRAGFLPRGQLGKLSTRRLWSIVSVSSILRTGRIDPPSTTLYSSLLLSRWCPRTRVCAKAAQKAGVWCSAIRLPLHALRRSGRTLHDALDHHGRDAGQHGLGLRGRQHVDDRVRRWRLLLRLGVATAEDVPELTGLLMQIGEHLAQVLRIGCYLSRQLHATRRGSLLQHLQELRSLFRRQLAQRLLRRLSVLVGGYGM